MLTAIAASISLIWYSAVVVVCIVGYTQILRHYSAPSPSAKSLSDKPEDVPRVTIIRPVKGPEPDLYQCLAATFRQTYPGQKLEICLCVSSLADPAVPVIQQILAKFPKFDARLLVEDQDPALQDGNAEQRGLGPNPKIRNMSRAYREAKGDLIWIIDCNVWVGPGVLGRMVDTLCGYNGKKKYKFVHQLPIVVDIDSTSSQIGLGLNGPPDQYLKPEPSSILKMGGGRLEELFMASSHAKFYTAINTVLIAPCIVGKSTMFRRSHLDFLTSSGSDLPPGLDYFSVNICEDHLIGDLLWKRQVREELQGEIWGKHALVFGDLAVQPMTKMSVVDYIGRRIRWLRVRKFTVTLATLVEPGTESLLCSLCGAYTFTTIPWLHKTFGLSSSWSTFWLFWVISVTTWAAFDRTLYLKLHSGSSLGVDQSTPTFARTLDGKVRRPFRSWLLAWLGREFLAFPIWFTAFFGGVTVNWRGSRFWVGTDMKVHAISEPPEQPQSRRLTSLSKARVE
ncbi:glycosyltransferase family 21 protein [Viridothelium virens]|uniref:Ceramide glucosyltransferase n=1 Tax=Viridothelium virens TaxID=1048519 RepID=A0A6A6H4K8_VIRVR|nr:glycosyltransferase family 21 protein [Viridothelium virens]